MADLDELEMIMARLADQASTSVNTSSSAAVTISSAIHVFSSSSTYDNNQQQANIKNDNDNDDDDDDDDDALSALRKGPNVTSSSSASSLLFANNEKDVKTETTTVNQKYAVDTIYNRVKENERKIQFENNNSGSSTMLNGFSTSTLEGELHLTSRCHNLLSDPDRKTRLDKWKSLCGGPLNTANLAATAGNPNTDMHDPTALARFAENFLEAWTLDSDSFLLRRARSILVGEMLFLMEVERDEGRNRRNNYGNNNNNQDSADANTNALFGNNSSSSSTHNNNNNNNFIMIHGQNEKREKLMQTLSKQKSFEQTTQNINNLPPARTLNFTPSSLAAQECIRLIHYDRFASNEKWLILLKEIKNLPLAKVRHIWQYAIKTFPATTWLVVDYLTLEIEAERQLFEQVKENQENNSNQISNNNNNRVNENNEEEWLAVLTARLRILDTFESHLRVCVGSAQLHTLFMQYLSQAVVGVDSATKLAIAKRCLQDAGRCFDAYSLWKEVLKTRVGLLDEANVIETRKIFHRLIETPLDNLEQAKAEYLSFENRVSTSSSFGAGGAGGGAPIAESLPPQLNQLFRSANDEFGERRRHWDVVAQRQRWLGNLAIRSSQEQIRLQVQQRLASQQGSTVVQGKNNMLKNLGASTAEQQLTALQQKTLASIKASRLGGSSLASVTLTLGQDEGKIPALEAEKAIANSLPTTFMPHHPSSVLNLSKRDGESTTENLQKNTDDEEFEFYLRKKLIEIQHMKSNNQNHNNNSLYDEYEELIDFLFKDDEKNNANKNNHQDASVFPSPFQGFTKTNNFNNNNNINEDSNNENEQDDYLILDDEDELNEDSDNNNKNNNKNKNGGFFGLNAALGKSSSSTSLRQKKLLRNSLFSAKNLIKQRLQALETGNRILSYHSAWDALIEIETEALKRLLDSANNNTSNSSGGSSSSSMKNTTSSILTLINSASPSRDVLMQIASRCRKVTFLWEQRCRSEACIPSNWLMWARSRIAFSAAKVKISNDTLSDDERRKEVEQVCSIFVEALSRFPDNLVLVNSFADYLTSYGDAKSANALFFSLSQQCVTQAKLLFLYEQEATMDVKNIVNMTNGDDNGNNNNLQLQQQQLQRIQSQRVQTLLQLLRSRNLQTFCEVEFNQNEQTENNNNNLSGLQQDGAEIDYQATISQQHQNKLMSLKQYPLPLCWRFCDRPRFSDSVIASVLASPYEPASLTLLRLTNHQQNQDQDQNENKFLSQITSRLSSLRNQIKDNITLSVVGWMKWTLRSKNTRYWSQGVTGFSEVSAAHLQHQQNLASNSTMESSLLHLRTVARYAVSACGIGRHPLFLHSWANLEAGCGSQSTAAQSVLMIAESWKKNILNAIVAAAKKFRMQLFMSISNSSSSSSSDPVRNCLIEISKALSTSSIVSSSSTFLKQCGADDLFFDTLRSLDLLSSSVRSSSSTSVTIFYENSFRQEIANSIVKEFLNEDLQSFISTKISSSSSNLSQLVFDTLKNFASNSNNNNNIQLVNNNRIFSAQPSMMNFSPIEIVQSTSPQLHQFLSEIRKLFIDSAAYRSLRLRSSNNDDNNDSSSSSMFMKFAQVLLSSTNQSRGIRSTMNFGEVMTLNGNDDDEEESTINTNADEMLLQQDSSVASTSSSSTAKPNFSFFTKVADGGTGTHSRGIKFESHHANNDGDEKKHHKKGENTKKNKKSDQTSSPASSAAASPLQFILPHLAHKQQLPTTTSVVASAAAAANLKNGKPLSKFDARQLHRQKMDQQQKEMIQSALTTRGPTDFYTTSLIDSHRRNSSWGWEAVLMKLVSTGGTGVAATKAEQEKTIRAKADEEDLAVFKSTLPMYQRTRTQNSNLMNAVLSRQADRDFDAIVADVAWQNEFSGNNNNNSNTSNNKTLLEKLLSSSTHHQNQQLDSVHSVVRNRQLQQPESSSSSSSLLLADNLLMQMLVDQDRDKIQQEIRNEEKSSSQEESAAAWDKFAGKFSSNALFRLIHRLPSSHGLGYRPSYRFRNNLILKNSSSTKKDNDDDEEEEEFDFVKSAFHRTANNNNFVNNAAKDGSENVGDADGDDDVNFYPTTRFVMETLMTKRLN